MNEKEELIKILETMKPYWDMAEIFIDRIKSKPVDTELLDQLGDTLEKSLLKVRDTSIRSKFLEARTLIRIIVTQESKEEEWEEADLLLEQL